MDRLKKYLLAAGAVFLCGWIFLFLIFLGKTFSYRNLVTLDPQCAYDVVILTGGRYRISTAIKFINKNNIQSIFISGVYPKTHQHHLFPRDKFLKNVPIILGKKARNTHENALEISEWRQQENVQEILLITSDYHMIRSLMEIKKANSDLRIIPYALKSKIDVRFFQNCLIEFHKIWIFFLVRVIF